MNRQQIRQTARKRAMEGQEEIRRKRAEKDKRMEGFAIDVLVAVTERDQGVRETEHRAGVAVRSMLEEGLSAAEVAQWCGGSLNAREARRLAHGVDDGNQARDTASNPPTGSGVM